MINKEQRKAIIENLKILYNRPKNVIFVFVFGCVWEIKANNTERTCYGILKKAGSSYRSKKLKGAPALLTTSVIP